MSITLSADGIQKRYGFAVVFTIVSRYLLGRAERLAKKQGLHIL